MAKSPRKLKPQVDLVTPELARRLLRAEQMLTATAEVFCHEIEQLVREVRAHRQAVVNDPRPLDQPAFDQLDNLHLVTSVWAANLARLRAIAITEELP